MTKREHVMSRAMGTFEQNWTLNCVCDDCNGYFADNLELPLGRDSREALLRIDLGLKPTAQAGQLLNRRVRTSLNDPGQFNGIRVLMAPADDGTDVIPVPVPQVGFRREGEDWRSLTERELTPDAVREFKGLSALEIRICGVGRDCDRLRRRLAELGIDFVETRRALDQPITEGSKFTVVYDVNVDETIVRAACKIGFNYAAKVLGAETVRGHQFDAARRFVRYGEAPVQIATVQRLSVLTGPGSESARIHACGIGWDRGYLVGLVSLFNEITYGLRLCAAEPGEFGTARHFLIRSHARSPRPPSRTEPVRYATWWEYERRNEGTAKRPAAARMDGLACRRHLHLKPTGASVCGIIRVLWGRGLCTVR